jgi:RNA polymerase sigma-70 factor, ECF subfamily
MEIPKSPIAAELPAVAGPAAGEPSEVGALVERAKRGDASAFDGLMVLYERRIIAIGVQMGLSRDDALDACQDTFVKVFRYIGGFRSGESFFKWLYRIAVHSVYDHLRRSRPAGVVSLEEIDSAQAGRLKDPGPSPAAAAADVDLREKLLAGLDTLSRQERIVFVLRDLQEIDSAEIARILRLSQVTVRRHCMTARQKLRRRLFPRDH